MVGKMSTNLQVPNPQVLLTSSPHAQGEAAPNQSTHSYQESWHRALGRLIPRARMPYMWVPEHFAPLPSCLPTSPLLALAIYWPSCSHLYYLSMLGDQQMKLIKLDIHQLLWDQWAPPSLHEAGVTQPLAQHVFCPVRCG